MAQYHWDDIFFEAGPYFSQLRAATPVVAQLNSIGTAAFRTRDAGFVIGFGYQDSTGVTVGWRYNGSLNNVFRPVDIDGSSQVQLRNSSIEFYLAYVFAPRQIIRLLTSPVRLIGGIGKGKRKIRSKARPAQTSKP